MAAFYLAELDERMRHMGRMARMGLSYVRFMDDIVVPAPTRWKLRRAVKILNQVLSTLSLEKHPVL